MIIRKLWLGAGFAAVLGGVAFADQLHAAPQEAPAGQGVLTNQDCVKCHTDAPVDIEQRGGAHKTAVTCQDCHEGHPPAVRDIIPACGKCHTGKPHYTIEGCLGCHSNPHAPLDLQLAKNITGPCLTCHDQQGVELRDHKSFHSSMACTACHEKHGQVPECLSCHKPHSSEMVQKDCVACHQAHMPLEVTYPADIPSASCGSCHDEALRLLAASTAKHRDLSCAACHADRHKTIPKCQNCHPSPHPEGILSKFPTCGECHNIAHDLNKWEAGAAKPAGASGTKPAQKGK